MVESGKEVSDGLSLGAKVDIAKTVIRDSFTQYKRPAIVWSAGKDSTTVLHLATQVAGELGLNLPPCMFLDHGDHFPETLTLVEKLSKEWKFKVVTARNDDILNNVSGEGIIELKKLNEKNKNEAKKVGFEGDSFEYTLNTAVGNHLLKTVPMNEVITKYQFDVLLTGIRWDENPARKGELFIKARSSPPHFRSQPILPFSEKDIWAYIFKYEVPYHPLYEKGYRSIDGKMDSNKTSDEPAWKQDLDNTNERAGRARDKEQMMEQLRKFGYM